MALADVRLNIEDWKHVDFNFSEKDFRSRLCGRPETPRSPLQPETVIALSDNESSDGEDAVAEEVNIGQRIGAVTHHDLADSQLTWNGVSEWVPGWRIAVGNLGRSDSVTVNVEWEDCHADEGIQESGPTTSWMNDSEAIRKVACEETRYQAAAIHPYWGQQEDAAIAVQQECRGIHTVAAVANVIQPWIPDIPLQAGGNEADCQDFIALDMDAVAEFLPRPPSRCSAGRTANATASGVCQLTSSCSDGGLDQIRRRLVFSDAVSDGDVEEDNSGDVHMEDLMSLFSRSCNLRGTQVAVVAAVTEDCNRMRLAKRCRSEGEVLNCRLGRPRKRVVSWMGGEWWGLGKRHAEEKEEMDGEDEDEEDESEDDSGEESEESEEGEEAMQEEDSDGSDGSDGSADKQSSSGDDDGDDQGEGKDEEEDEEDEEEDEEDEEDGEEEDQEPNVHGSMTAEAAPASQDASNASSSAPNQLYVGGIPYHATDDDICAFFESCGKVASIHRLTFPDSGRFRGIVFLTFKVGEWGSNPAGVGVGL